MTRSHTKKAKPQPKREAQYEPSLEEIAAAREALKDNFTPLQHWDHTHERPYIERRYEVPVVGR